MNYFSKETKFGWLYIEEASGSITKVSFKRVEGGNPSFLIERAFKEIDEYLAGARKEFTVPICPKVTGFQEKVLNALRTIPYGETRSYKQIAQMIGNPNACRAVGMANNRNPIAIIIPCHRVIGAQGSLTGYAGGLKLKEALLRIEQA